MLLKQRQYIWTYPQAKQSPRLVVKKLPDNEGDIRYAGSVPGSGRSPGGGHGNPLQYPSLENPMDTGAWQATVHRVAKSWHNGSDLAQHKEYSTLCVCKCPLNPKDLLGICDIFFCLFQKKEPDSMHFSKVAVVVGFNTHSLEKVNVNMQHRELRLEKPIVVLNHFIYLLIFWCWTTLERNLVLFQLLFHPIR